MKSILAEEVFTPTENGQGTMDVSSPHDLFDLNISMENVLN
jgi:hypothetical protein